MANDKHSITDPRSTGAVDAALGGNTPATASSNPDLKDAAIRAAAAELIAEEHAHVDKKGAGIRAAYPGA